MKENRTVPYLKARMALVAKVYKIERQSDWLEILELKDPSSISRMISSNKISDHCINSICAMADIKEEDFLGPIPELSSKLGLNVNIADNIVKGNITNEIMNTSSKDAKLLSNISGRYMMVYASRELYDHELEYTTIEELRFELEDISRGTFKVTQISNHVTNQSAMGRGKCRSERISMQIYYDGLEYPDSQILISPLVSTPENNIFSGIYVDVNNIHQIWATQVVIFQVSEVFVIPRRFPVDSELHVVWKPILENRLGDRHRLIARNGDDYLYSVRAAVKQSKSG